MLPRVNVTGNLHFYTEYFSVLSGSAEAPTFKLFIGTANRNKHTDVEGFRELTAALTLCCFHMPHPKAPHIPTVPTDRESSEKTDRYLLAQACIAA